MNGRSDLLLSAISKFYSDNPKNVEILKSVLEKSNGISLRNLEWFITNYSKKTNLKYRTPNGTEFTVHCAYKSTLDGYSKKLFDPFCRSGKIDFTLPYDNTTIQTTVAQLNFIKWCITNNIIDYLTENKKKLLGK